MFSISKPIENIYFIDSFNMYVHTSYFCEVGPSGSFKRRLLKIFLICTLKGIKFIIHCLQSLTSIYLIVVDLRRSPTAIRLYACHMSSASSGTRATNLQISTSITILHNYFLPKLLHLNYMQKGGNVPLTTTPHFLT